ncbi:MAG: histidine kinase [Bacteroidales bacterium]
MKHLKKNYRLVLIVLFAMLYLSLFGQNQTIDSLKYIISTCKGDTTKTRLLNDLAKLYWNVDLDKSIQIANSAIVMAKKQHNYYEESRGYNVIGGAYYRKGDIDKAYNCHKKCFDISCKYNFIDNIKKSAYNIATSFSLGKKVSANQIKSVLNVLLNVSKYKKIDYLTIMPFILFDGRSLSMNDSKFDIVSYLDSVIPEDDSRLINLKNIVKGAHYRFNGEYFKSINYAIKVIQNTKDALLVMTANEILSEGNFMLRRYKEARINQEIALQLINKSTDPFIKTKLNLSEGGLGCILIELKEYKKAYKYIKKSLNISNIPYNIAVVNNNMAVIYIKLDSAKLAEPYLNKALRITDSLNIYPIHLAALNTLYELQTKLNQPKKLNKTIVEIEKTIPRVSEWYSVYDGYKLLKEYYKSKGDLKKSLLFSEKLLQVNDTIKNKETSQLLEEMAVKYETQQKDDLIKLQNTKSQKDNLVIFILSISMILIIILIIILVFLVFKKRKQDKIIHEKLENELQLKTLQSKVIPHFTNNVLSAIGYLAITDRLMISHYIAAFSRFTSLTLENADKNYTSLRNEIEYIENYLELEKLRFGERFVYSIVIDKDINQNILVPAMALHTYCDNAVRHGLVHKESGGQLLVEILAEEHNTRIRISDNGIGRTKAREFGTRGNGQGLTLIQAQLDFYNKHNKYKITQQITDLYDNQEEPQGTVVELVIPHDYSFEK